MLTTNFSTIEIINPFNNRALEGVPQVTPDRAPKTKEDLSKVKGGEGKETSSSQFPNECSDDEDDSEVLRETFTHLHYKLQVEMASEDFFVPAFPVPLSKFQHLPVGDRMQVAFPNWRCIGSSDYVVSILQHGYALEFDSLPNLVSNPPPFYLPLSAEQNLILDEEMQKFIDGHVIEPVKDRFSPGFYSPLFLRPKTDKGWRIIINLSSLNRCLVYHRFRMETINTVRQSLKIGQFAFALDLSSAYSHIPVHPNSRKYLRFFWKNRAYQFRNLPFGLSSAPYIFSLIVSQVAKYFHRHAIFSHFYLDDWQFFADSAKILNQHKPQIIFIVSILGWLINFEKSDLDVSQQSVYIGGDFDLHGIVKPTQKRWSKIQSLIPEFCKLSAARAGHWSSILGILTSTQDLTFLGRLQLRQLQYHLNDHWKDRSNENVLIPITEDCRTTLKWWLQESNVMTGVPFQPPAPELTIFTDSSLIGYGATLGTQHFSGTWSAEQSKMHINYLEMLSLYLAILHFQDQLRGKSVLAASDNTTVVCFVNKNSGTRSKVLHDLTYKLLHWCFQNNITLRARHIPGRLNLLADGLSRDGRVIQTEWKLNTNVFQSVCQTWQVPNVDLFATAQNHQLPVYFSPIPDAAAAGIDSLAQDWTGIVGYAYPPPAIIQLVLNKLECTSNCLIILIVPKWERKAWFPKLLNMLIDFPKQLPHYPNLLKQPLQYQFHPDPQALNLHACLLSSNILENKAFLRKLPNVSHTKQDFPPTNCTSYTGKNILFGVLHNKLIHSNPLYL